MITIPREDKRTRSANDRNKDIVENDRPMIDRKKRGIVGFRSRELAEIDLPTSVETYLKNAIRKRSKNGITRKVDRITIVQKDR